MSFKMPPLPASKWRDSNGKDFDRFTADQVDAYGRAVLEAVAAWLHAEANKPSNCIIGPLDDAARKLRAAAKEQQT